MRIYVEDLLLSMNMVFQACTELQLLH